MTLEIILAFDFGLRKIGVATGQTLTKSATPLAPLAAERGVPKWEIIQNLIELWKPGLLLVGLPYKMDGSEQGISFAARQFAKALQERFNLPVRLVDERLTTREAKRQLSHGNMKPKDLPSVDSYAAKLILESWMNSQSALS